MSRKYAKADKIARQLEEGRALRGQGKGAHRHLTDEGVREAERLAGVESFYTAGNMEWPHLIDNCAQGPSPVQARRELRRRQERAR